VERAAKRNHNSDLLLVFDHFFATEAVHHRQIVAKLLARLPDVRFVLQDLPDVIAFEILPSYKRPDRDVEQQGSAGQWDLNLLFKQRRTFPMLGFERVLKSFSSPERVCIKN
jgi:hypothetical protein